MNRDVSTAYSSLYQVIISMQWKRCDLYHTWPHRETNDNSLLLLLYFTTMNKHNLFYESISTLFSIKELMNQNKYTVFGHNQGCVHSAGHVNDHGSSTQHHSTPFHWHQKTQLIVGSQFC